jgi:hypothetical protein
MVSPTVRDTVHATDRVAGELEEWQLTFGQGPCVDAFNDGGPVLAGDLRSPACLARWPVFTPAALDSGGAGGVRDAAAGRRDPVWGCWTCTGSGRGR